MASNTIIIVAVLGVFGLGLLLKPADARPDSAGVVEMVNGLAYGGIPYGSVSGMLGNKVAPYRQAYYPYNSVQRASVSVLVPDTRTAGVIGPIVDY